MNRAVVLLMIAMASMLWGGCVESTNPPDSGDLTLPYLPSPVLVDCLWHKSDFVWPSSTGPGDVPPGWRLAGGITSTNTLVFLSCGHVGWGNFQKQNVSMILDYSFKAYPPDGCEAPSGSNHAVLGAWIFSDENLAEWAAEALGVPAFHASFSLTPRESEPFSEFQWQWTPTNPAGQTSSMLFQISDDSTPSTAPSVLRIFWDNGSGISFIDNSVQGSFGVDAQLVATGSLHAPMQHETTPLDDWIGSNTVVRDARIESELSTFEDYECS